MIYLVVWSGGYEVPQYDAFKSREAALDQADNWRQDADDDDIIDVLEIDKNNLTIELLAIKGRK